MKAEKDVRKVLKAVRAEIRRPCDSQIVVEQGGKEYSFDCPTCLMKREALETTAATLEWVLQESPEGDRWEERILKQTAATVEAN
jgi:hypothetical protein